MGKNNSGEGPWTKAGVIVSILAIVVGFTGYTLKNLIDNDRETTTAASISETTTESARVKTTAELIRAGTTIELFTVQVDLATKIARGQMRNLLFGGYTWRVLDVQGDKALLITEDIIELHPYHSERVAITWETCALRAYLNGEFFGKFSAQEQAVICDTSSVNADNQWYRINGGNNTTDKVFLLSIEEVVRYFGDSGLLKKQPEGSWWIDDNFNINRVAMYSNDVSWWLLRSPGNYPNNAAFVHKDGRIYIVGIRVDREGGVRPALWLQL